MRYSLHRGAELDLPEAARFYRQEGGPKLASRFLDEYARVVELLLRSSEDLVGGCAHRLLGDDGVALALHQRVHGALVGLDVQHAGLARADQLLVFKYQDQGVATLEDGLYATEKSLADPKMADKLARFVKASVKGWDYAVKNQAEAVKIVLKNDASGAQKEAHQARMMGEIAKLVEGGSLGKLDAKAYERTVATLMSGKSDPVITKKPSGATTDKIYLAAQK